MLFIVHLIYIILLNPLIASLQINLAFTNQLNDIESNITYQHNCLYGDASISRQNGPYQIIAYCGDESLLKWKIQPNSEEKRFTFEELRRQNITSQQLYLWSAPIDIAESYEYYQIQKSTSDSNTSMEMQFFYNCTLPYFGPLCQYVFDEYEPYYTSLNEIIHNSYLFASQSDTLTCYMHLQCNRGPAPLCLDWTEICNGKFDCIDGEQDEEHCWQLEINECQAHEYRCRNGQCISEEFFRDDIYSPDCFDTSDENFQLNSTYEYCTTAEPTFGCEDVACLIFDMIDPLSFLTSSCLVQRNDFIKKQILMKPNSTSEFCWSLFKCFLDIPTTIENKECYEFCTKHNCTELLRQNCDKTLYIPSESNLPGGLYFTYTTEKMLYSYFRSTNSTYMCINDKFCDKMFLHGRISSDKNVSCYPLVHFFPFYNPDYSYSLFQMIQDFIPFDRACYSIISNRSELCRKPNMYQCINTSKCISRYRINDRINDCFYDDDEFVDIHMHYQIQSHFGKCFSCLQQNVCISYTFVKDGVCHCKEDIPTRCEDENPELIDAKKNISFQIVCDGFVDLLPIIIDGKNETDETECEQWPCNNSYTHCNGHWNCPNGLDEIDCNPTPLLNCSSKHHLCVSAETNNLTCLPLDKAGDGNIDCLGATDEPLLCQYSDEMTIPDPFYCKRSGATYCISIDSLCDGYANCLNNEDERFCEKNKLPEYTSICDTEYTSIRSNVQKFICEYPYHIEKWPIVHFSLGEIGSSAEPILHIDDKTVIQHSFNTRRHQQLCHRGLHLRLWIDKKKNLTTIICLCPPSFYGDSCQYQNQRVSVTMQFRSLSDSWRTPFAIVISLIDDSYERTIHSVEQLMYLPIRNCQKKFNVYLLYSTRPKNQSRNYSIHIDIYEKISLAYRGSLLLSIPFPFLPINRLVVQLNITSDRDIIDSCLEDQCVHGRCITYTNTPTRTIFCQCHRGWSGRYCTIPHHCTCSSNSLCIGVLANNRSICVCPSGRFGSRCLLTNTVCQLNRNATCKNSGQCIPQEENIHSNKKYTCICRNGFTGEQCENHDAKVTISFHKEIDLPSTILVHFIQVKKNAAPVRATTFKAIAINEDSVNLYWSHPFHIVFVELFDKKYHLAVVQRLYNRSKIINKMITSTDRCKHISELFNETMVKLHLVRRIKYYHLPCQQNASAQLSCFYDDVHLCLCENDGHQRLANCFKFDHNMKLDCSGQSSCENGGRCFQDSSTCAQTSLCICPACFYGRRCQFSTSGFSLSLDPILSYHIQPHVKLSHQPTSVKLVIGFSVVITAAGLLSGFLSLLTFWNKELHKVGCGIYLLGSSITTLLTMSLFSFKLGLLISTQMNLIMNLSFLHFQCKTVDFILSASLHMDQWLNACVAIERAKATIQGVNFNKNNSKQIARWMILALVILTTLTGIHDPIYRRLLDDNHGDQQRIWCIVSYSSNVQTFNRFIQAIHFFAPFVLNIISTLIIMIISARRRAAVRWNRTYKEHIIHQFRQHKNILIAPIIFVILILPRLIIAFTSGCMKSSRESTIYLVGYFISFIPPMLTFVVFVMPSKVYRAAFITTVETQRQRIRTYFNRIV